MSIGRYHLLRSLYTRLDRSRGMGSSDSRSFRGWRADLSGVFGDRTRHFWATSVRTSTGSPRTAMLDTQCQEGSLAGTWMEWRSVPSARMAAAPCRSHWRRLFLQGCGLPLSLSNLHRQNKTLRSQDGTPSTCVCCGRRLCHYLAMKSTRVLRAHTAVPTHHE